ncbi:MAG: hypothetical protein KAR17_14285, partial [Cyclobacteriaceae bacterium]|nr:hypothetical protein [Cyclobacteriaceae bacterium]
MFKALAESLQLIRICNPNKEHSSSGSFRIVNPKERSFLHQGWGAQILSCEGIRYTHPKVIKTGFIRKLL